MMPLHNRSDSGSSLQFRGASAGVGRVSPPVIGSVQTSPQSADVTERYPSARPDLSRLSSPTATPEVWRYSLGGASQGLIAFCLLNAILGLLFEQMFRNNHISFQLTAMHHGWGVEQKAKACHNAALGYVVLAALTLCNPWLSRYVGAWFCIAKRNARSGCRRFVPKERLSLLGYSRKGSDDSCDEEDDEMRGLATNAASRRSGQGSRTVI
jgi:hypothetical protein